MPVNSMAAPAWFAVAITSASRRLPPGWIAAVAPARSAASRPSGNGKKASDATTLPTIRDWPSSASRLTSAAFSIAIRTASTRLI